MESFHFLHVLGGCLSGLSPKGGLMTGLFLAGLIGGFTHCVAMCGAFVIAQTGRLEKKTGWLLLPYHAGRITTYVFLAVLLSGVLNIAFLFLPIRHFILAPILLLSGLIFLCLAFPSLLKIFPWVAKIHLMLPRPLQNWIGRRAQKIESVKIYPPIGQYMMGVLLGFMPCGLVMSALMAASTAQTPIMAGVAMAAFGVGTLPALILTAFGGRHLLIRFPHISTKLKTGAMVASSLWLFLIAGFLLT